MDIATPVSIPRTALHTTWARLAALLLAAMVLVPASYEYAYRGRIYPGVTVAGVRLGGLSAAEALAELAGAGIDPQAPVVFHAADTDFTLDGPSSGLSLDARATVAAAYAIGRTGLRPAGWLQMLGARLVGRHLQPVVLFDGRRAASAIARLAEQVDRPARDAALSFDSTAVHATEPQVGRRLDQKAALARLRSLAVAGTWPVDEALPVITTPPAVADLAAALADAEALLTGPLKLHADDKSWTLTPEALASMLTTRVQDGAVVLSLDEERFASWMTTVTEAISRTARSPRFHFDPQQGELTLLEPGQVGQVVDLAATARRILRVPARRKVQVAVVTVPPPVSDNVTAAELGIRELVWEETSHYVGSPAARMHNIALAASRFDGLLVPPGGILSFNEHVGEISEEEGYQKTKIIKDGATAEGVGGGVCQVSTTLFRTAFWAGLPIVERLAHGYRVSYYEQQAPAGLDATVFRPTVDLKFANDTGAWLLVETESSAKAATVTFRLWGTRPNREVRMEGPEITDITTPPPPRTEVDPQLPPGASEKRELERNGATVRVTRIIIEDGQERRETFHSVYRPTGAVTAVGPAPGQPIPGPGASSAARPASGVPP